MAMVLMVDTPGMTQDQYDASVATMGIKDVLPEGCSAHIAGPTPDGAAWRVVTVWENQDLARQFMTQKLRPAQEAHGITPPSTPPVIWPLHSLVV